MGSHEAVTRETYLWLQRCSSSPHTHAPSRSRHSSNAYPASRHAGNTSQPTSATQLYNVQIQTLISMYCQTVRVSATSIENLMKSGHPLLSATNEHVNSCLQNKSTYLLHGLKAIADIEFSAVSADTGCCDCSATHIEREAKSIWMQATSADRHQNTCLEPGCRATKANLMVQCFALLCTHAQAVRLLDPSWPLVC